MLVNNYYNLMRSWGSSPNTVKVTTLTGESSYLFSSASEYAYSYISNLGFCLGMSSAKLAFNYNVLDSWNSYILLGKGNSAESKDNFSITPALSYSEASSNITGTSIQMLSTVNNDGSITNNFTIQFITSKALQISELGYVVSPYGSGSRAFLLDRVVIPTLSLNAGDAAVIKYAINKKISIPSE